MKKFIILLNFLLVSHLIFVVHAVQDPYETPKKGCVFVWRMIDWKIEICQNVTNLSPLKFDKSIIAIKIGPWTKATLFKDYGFSNELTSLETSGVFFRLPADKSCLASSISLDSTETFLITGEIKNADTGSAIPSRNFTLNPLTITFSNSEKVYKATIFPQNSSYSIAVPAGKSYTQRVFTNSFSAQLKLLDVKKDVQGNSILVYPFGGTAKPNSGCVWLYENYFSFVEVCENNSDLRAWAKAGDLISSFDKATIAVKIGPWTKAILYKDYNYTGISYYLERIAELYPLPTPYSGAISSLKVVGLKYHFIQGYIRNADNNALLPQQNFTLNPLAITFDNSKVIYPAKINAANSTYSVLIPEGTYIQRIFANSFSAQIKFFSIHASSNEKTADEQNTAYVYPFGGSASPQKGCVWLYQSFFSFFQVCESVSDLKNWKKSEEFPSEFEEETIALKLGPWTGVTLYSDPDFSGKTLHYPRLGLHSFHKVRGSLACRTSSVKIINEKVYTIRGFIRNGDKNKTFTALDFKNYYINITFSDTFDVYSATINLADSTYSITIPEGAYQRKGSCAIYSSEQKFYRNEASSDEKNQKNTVYFYSFDSKSLPGEGCVWLYQNLFIFIELCNSSPDLRAENFDKTAVSVKVGSLTKLLIHSDYNYKGISQEFASSGFYKLNSTFSCRVSSIQTTSTRVKIVSIRGYIKNGNTKDVFSKATLTSNQTTVTFTSNGGVYNATINHDNSIYSIQLPIGEYTVNGIMTDFTFSSKTLEISADSDEKSSENIIYMFPLSSEWKAVLRWSGEEVDLDSWVLLPDSSTVNYLRKASGSGIVELEGDVKKGGGLETIVFDFEKKDFAGDYKYFVTSYRKFLLIESKASVTIERGINEIKRFTVPVESTTYNPLYWHVFTLKVNATSQELITVNAFTNTME